MPRSVVLMGRGGPAGHGVAHASGSSGSPRPHEAPLRTPGPQGSARSSATLCVPDDQRRCVDPARRRSVPSRLGVGHRPTDGDNVTTHPSSSHEHQAAEAAVLDGLRCLLNAPDLGPASVQVGEATVELDGWSPSQQWAVEVYARVTRPKGGAVKKPMDDAMLSMTP